MNLVTDTRSPGRLPSLQPEVSDARRNDGGHGAVDAVLGPVSAGGARVGGAWHHRPRQAPVHPHPAARAELATARGRIPAELTRPHTTVTATASLWWMISGRRAHADQRRGSTGVDDRDAHRQEPRKAAPELQLLITPNDSPLRVLEAPAAAHDNGPGRGRAPRGGDPDRHARAGEAPRVILVLFTRRFVVPRLWAD